MSTNVSKQKRKDLTDKIKAIHKHIASSKQDDNTRNFLTWLSDIEKEINSKKFGLVFEEHREGIDETLETHVPVLKEEKKLFIDNGGQVNFLIEGDNLAALKLLQKTHKGKIDVIYIDPPYNTGAKDWKYDNDYVDKNDTFKHSKWLSLMSKRLQLSKILLSSNGIICVTIDDYELRTLWLLLDDIFGEDNNLGCVTIRNNPKGRMTKRKVSQVHEYALFYGKSRKSVIKKLPVAPEDKSHNYVQDKDGTYYVKVNLRKQGVDSEAIKSDGTYRERYFPVYYDPKTKKISATEKLPVKILPIDNNGNERIWRRNEEGINNLAKKGDLFCTKIKETYQIHFKFRGGLDGEIPKSIWYDSFFSASEYGTTIINEILGREKFQYPKSLPAVIYALKCCSNKKNITILDFFAGSGTTGHAVIELNKEDKGKRNFILCTNNENNICKDITYQRIKTVITGKKKDNSNYSDGFNASLKYYRINYITISDKLYYEYADELLEHIQELVELENAINFTGNDKIAIILSDDELLDFIKNIKKNKNCRKLYRGHDILISSTQRETLKKAGIKTIVIPDYYYGDLGI